MNIAPDNLSASRLVPLEALSSCLHNLEEAIASVLQPALPLPEGEFLQQLLDQVSDFDSIADLVRQPLDAADALPVGMVRSFDFVAKAGNIKGDVGSGE